MLKKLFLSSSIVSQFLQVLPISLLALVWAPNNFWTYIWYYLFHGFPGMEIGQMFVLEYNLIPSILLKWKGELTGGSWVQFMAVGNVLMFLPLGLLLPMINYRVNWNNMPFVFLGCSLLVEVV